MPPKRKDPHDNNEKPLKQPRPRKQATKKEPVQKQGGRKAEDEAEEIAQEDLGDPKEIEWTSELTFILLARLTENESIKNGLYPGPGANVSISRGGGLTKTEHQFKLFEATFGDDVDWQPLIQRAKDPNTSKKLSASLRKRLAGKIKNRLNKMATQTREITQALGETGNGINSADEIDMSKNNKFTSIWAAYCDTCPWYFEMRNLIADRPNARPTGIGNSQSGIDMDVLDSNDEGNDDQKYGSQDDDLGTEGGDTSYLGTSAPGTPSAASSDDEQEKHPTAKRTKPATKKSGPRPSASKPVKLEEKKPMKKSRNDEFAEIAKAEEKMAQSELELAKMKMKLEMEQLRGQFELKKLKMEAKEKAAQRKHDLQMAMMRSRHTPSHFPSNPASFSHNSLPGNNDSLIGGSDTNMLGMGGPNDSLSSNNDMGGGWEGGGWEGGGWK